MSMCVVVHGNPCDGVTIIGPFDNSDEAGDWAGGMIDGDWWIASLVSQAEVEAES